MQIEYQRDLRDHYLVLHGTQKLAADAYQVHMIQENSMQGFTACHTELVDDEIRYAYRITSMQSLEEIAEIKPVGTGILRELFRSLTDALQELEHYLLQQDGVLLQPSFIFTDAARQKFLFCYYPENEKTVSEGMRDLSEFLLPHLDEHDRQAVMLGFSFYQSCTAGEMTETRLKELVYAKRDVSAEGSDRDHQMRDLTERKDSAGTGPDYLYDTNQREMSSEELRAKILDDFFSDEEEAEEERRQQKHRRLLWFLLAAVCALGTAAVLAVSGWIQTGIGAGVLIEALAVLLWRYRKQLFALKTGFKQSIRQKRGDDDPYLDVDPDWHTYEERAEALDWQEQNTNMPEPADERDIQQRSCYEETVWLGAAEADDPAVQTWLEEIESGSTEIKDDKRQMRGEGSRRILLTEQEHLIGKSAEMCDIAVSSAAVSRMHARLTRGEQGYTVTDLRSRNGTFINGAMLEAGKPFQLHDGDTARFADAVFRYCCGNRRR